MIDYTITPSMITLVYNGEIRIFLKGSDLFIPIREAIFEGREVEIPSLVAPPPPEDAPLEKRIPETRLSEMTLGELRRFASNTLKIKGASKIPGGRLALLNAILQDLSRLAQSE